MTGVIVVATVFAVVAVAIGTVVTAAVVVVATAVVAMVADDAPAEGERGQQSQRDG